MTQKRNRQQNKRKKRLQNMAVFGAAAAVILASSEEVYFECRTAFTAAACGVFSENGTAVENETAAESETDTEYESEMESETIPQSENAPQSETVPETGTVAESEITPEDQTAAGSSTVPGSEITPEAQTAAGSSTVPESETVPQSETLPESGTTPQSEMELQSEAMPQSETVLQSEAMPQSETVLQSETIPQSETVLQSEVMPQSETVLQSETIPQSETVLQSEVMPQNVEAGQEELQPGNGMMPDSAVQEFEPSYKLEQTAGEGAQRDSGAEINIDMPGASDAEKDTDILGNADAQAGEKAENGETADAEEAETAELESAQESETGFEAAVPVSTADTEESPMEMEGQTEGDKEEKEKEEEKGEKEKEEEKGEKEKEKEKEEKTEDGEDSGKEGGKKKKKAEKNYKIVGDDEMWYRDESGHLWVRPGSSLYVEAGAGSECIGGHSFADLQEDGAVTFHLKSTGEADEAAAAYQEPYAVDGEAPPADIRIPGEAAGGITYVSDTAAAQITVAPDGGSGLKASAYLVLECDSRGRLLQQPQDGAWLPSATNHTVQLEEEGVYQIYVRTEDNVGNIRFSKSGIVCVDRTAPVLTVDGVQDQTANSGQVKLKIQGEDEHYKPGSLQVECVGVNNGKVPKVSSKEETDGGAIVQYFDFPAQKSYDDVYRLSVTAEDQAGNRAEKKMEFSVNRYGSVYELSEDTRERLGQYFLAKAEPITFYETNIDYVGESSVYCRRDGELTLLECGKDYSVAMTGTKDSWKRYCYTVPASYFGKEGVYELLLTSKDRADNVSDTGIQKKQVAFVLDWTAPGCTITGIEAGRGYDAERITACITPHDNIGIKQMKIFRDSILELGKGELGKGGETVKLALSEAEHWQTIQVQIEDMAGNVWWSPEIPVFVGKNTEEAPAYGKIRMSAQELAESELEKDTDVISKSSTKIEKEKKLSADSAGAGQLKAKHRSKGTALLALGIVMFAVTAASFAINGTGRKK